MTLSLAGVGLLAAISNDVWTRLAHTQTLAPSDPASSLNEGNGMATGAWQHISDAPIDGRIGQTAVWDGRQMVVWGGEPRPSFEGGPIRSDGSDGASYRPDRDSWTLLPEGPLSARSRHLAAWTGKEMLLWGGVAPGGGRTLLDGAAYDPATNRWRLIGSTPFRGAGESSGTWAGTEWLVLYGCGAPDRPSIQAALYDPAADRWRAVDDLRVPEGSACSTAWVGSAAIVLIRPRFGAASAYSLSFPAASWTAIAAPPFDGLNAGEAMSWTGDALLVGTSGVLAPARGTSWDQVAVYRPGADCWSFASLPPDALHSLDGVWSGRFLVFFGGSQPSFAYDPKVDKWWRLPAIQDRGREGASVLWASDRLIAWGGSGSGTGLRSPDGVSFTIPAVSQTRFTIE